MSSTNEHALIPISQFKDYSLGHITCPVLFIHYFVALKSQFDTFFWSRMVGLGLQFPILVLNLNFVQNKVELCQF